MMSNPSKDHSVWGPAPTPPPSTLSRRVVISATSNPLPIECFQLTYDSIVANAFSIALLTADLKPSLIGFLSNLRCRMAECRLQ
ncbi:hypothetical protein AVEN_147857-1 [Araneus ventricosus]|uniref:Uncharacterized protein n=1 Tax=Araneus ventricosus TaxID=182803 RepID=A0A4Y2CR24_ARAVE|nr:hypothetical protein AVEN_147857-1 [Araneus ventricosus]